MDNSEKQFQKTVSSKPTPLYSQVAVKGPNKVVKALSENKLKRLNILSFINDKKDILFTKKAFKFEKERIWRQIFQKMIEFGMVSAEKDWRYVRDVSFSNWRKRAQKRLRHLAANGHRLNMDECEFLICDILGQTPDKSTDNSESPVYADNIIASNATSLNEDDDESDEYMIDSDEDDDEGVMFDEMLYIPKIVFNDNVRNNDKVNNDSEKSESVVSTNGVSKQPPTVGQMISSVNRTSMEVKNESKQDRETKLVNGKSMANVAFAVNGMTPSRHYSAKCSVPNGQGNNVSDVATLSLNNRRSAAKPTMSNTNDEVADHPISHQEPLNPINNKDSMLLELEIENKLLKNRYMKLKIFELERTLGVDHCKEVKELADLKYVLSSQQCNNGKGNK